MKFLWCDVIFSRKYHFIVKDADIRCFFHILWVGKCDESEHFRFHGYNYNFFTKPRFYVGYLSISLFTINYLYIWLEIKMNNSNSAVILVTSEYTVFYWEKQRNSCVIAWFAFIFNYYLLHIHFTMPISRSRIIVLEQRHIGYTSKNDAKKSSY